MLIWITRIDKSINSLKSIYYEQSVYYYALMMEYLNKLNRGNRYKRIRREKKEKNYLDLFWVAVSKEENSSLIYQFRFTI